MLTEEIEAEIASFDSQIEELSSKKIMLEFEMKLAEMLLITTYQELIIIEAFEAKDQMLLAEHERQKDKDDENAENVLKNDAQYKEKKDSERNFEAKQKDAEAKFNEKITVSKEVAAIAYKIYKEKNKKNKNLSDQDDGNGEDQGMDDDEVDYFNLEIKRQRKQRRSQKPSS